LTTLDFHPQGYDMTKIAQGHQRSELPGKLLIAESDCKSCHLIDQKSAGPSYKEVAKRYSKDVKATDVLSNKIMNGGSGVWGEVAMAAHPQLTKAQTTQMVEYILSLANEEKIKSLPLAGKANFAVVPPPGPAATSAYVLTVTYEDNGANGMPSLSATKQVFFNAPILNANNAADLTGGLRKSNAAGFSFLDNVKHNSSATFKGVDLSGVGKLNLVVVEQSNSKSGEVEIWLDSKTGTKLGSVNFENAPKMEVQSGIFMRPGGISIPATSGKHDLVLVFKNEKAGEGDLFIFNQVSLAK
jgi:cytochrome c